jgi:sugar phosphate isomerase/epimerase
VIEATAGGVNPKTHFDPVELASNADALARFRESLELRGIKIAAFGCFGNPLHPDSARRAREEADFEATCRVAASLGVSRVAVKSGCPGAGPADKAPNWIVNFISPDLRRALEWQWEDRLIPYWRRAAEVAEANHVRICMEPHGGDLVYNLQTFQRLRAAVGPLLGALFDPSHLFWQGIDVLAMIRELGSAIQYVHAKDVSMHDAVVRSNGLVANADFVDWAARPWVYRAVGSGHDLSFWKEFVTALRRVGYDDALVIEIEDPFLSTDDAIAMSVETLRSAVPAQPYPSGHWYDGYESDAVEVEA